MQHLAEDHHREQGAEDGDQVDEDAGAVGADDLVAPDEQHLGDERGEDGGEGRDQPAGGVGPGDRAARRLVGGKRQRGEEGRGRHHRDHRLPVQFGLVAKCHGVAAIAEDGEQHQRVALVEFEPDQPRQAAARGGDRHAREREREAHDLRRRHPDAEQDEIGEEDHHRHARLLDGDVDRRGVLERRVEQDVERGEADRAIGHQERQVGADHLDVAAHLRQREREQDRQRQPPAHRGQEHRRDVADGHLAGHRVGAPGQRGDGQEQIGAQDHLWLSQVCRAGSATPGFRAGTGLFAADCAIKRTGRGRPQPLIAGMRGNCHAKKPELCVQGSILPGQFCMHARVFVFRASCEGPLSKGLSWPT